MKTKCRQFLIPDDDNYHLYLKGVVYFYLHVKYYLCCSKCQSQIITKSESTFVFQGAERSWKSSYSHSLKDEFVLEP